MRTKIGIGALFIGALLVALTVGSSCGDDGKGNDPVKPNDPPKTDVQPKQFAPPFNADSAYQYIKEQVDLGPRNPGSPAHAKCADMLVSKLKAYGLETIVQKTQMTMHDKKTFTLKNIIASYRPEQAKRILLCAHWDTRHIAEKDQKDKERPILGADDGGSGVGVLLEIARQLSISKPEIGIDIVLFDLEDYGLNGGGEDTWGVGSQYWSKNLHKPGYTAQYGILLDMVGAKDATFAREGYSRQFASHVVAKIWTTATRAGYSYYFVDADVDRITDDHYYVNEFAGIPTADIINVSPVTGSFGSHHHTQNDNMDVIDRNTLKAVGQTVLEVVFSEAAPATAQKDPK